MWPAVPTTMDRIASPAAAAAAFPLLALAPAGTLRPAQPFVLGPRAAAPRPALAVAHALEDLGQAEIDLALLHVHANDLDLHLVAEPIDLVGVLAAQQVRVLDELVVVVGHRRDVDHALDEVLGQLHEQPERCHAGD